MKNFRYSCPESQCDHIILSNQDDGLLCTNGHFFPFIQGTHAPVFACDADNANDYAQEKAVTIHDNSFQWVFQTFGTDESTLRNNLVSRLNLSPNQTILVTGVGSGNDLPFLAKKLQGKGTIYAQDISKQMLIAGIQKYESNLNEFGVDVFFSASDATNLPFEDNFFDAAYHFGGLNLFSDIQKGIFEMDRVVKTGGQVLICDEGIAPWLKETELGKMLIKNNPLYAYETPLSFLPQNARSVKLSWELSHCFYVIEFIVSDTVLPINIDVPHIGKRGGSIRTRYMGQLEGVDPALRDKVYAMAEKLEISRVEYLERLLRTGCEL
ncbi:class I SAM-dependent methyltransferase [Legionella fallonii]|uniref:Type 11 methyltransferase (Modular protein) n=1 Tax=Legionella fallonii LLAP-10 TaxID=1212491 RepID=A0A098G7B9_9GAMM|nr:methyltransferase domain-containing protein [Legionella fallonii]CEG58358.1 Type 11 methyltransferase (modular protein) [Legionella fallonii LLAP-10]